MGTRQLHTLELRACDYRFGAAYYRGKSGTLPMMSYFVVAVVVVVKVVVVRGWWWVGGEGV